MEDETMIKSGFGTENYDPMAEGFDEVDQLESDMKLKQKFEALEKEKHSLASENEEIKAQIQQLMSEIELLRSDESKLKLRLEIMESEKQESEESKRALEAISTRAFQLETEVFRLQHDLISALSAAEESNAELFVLKKVLREKEETFEEIKKDKIEVEKKLLDLEIKLEERSKETVIEEEMRNQKIDEYEKKLQESKEKMKEMEEKMLEMLNKLDESEKDIGGLKERSMEDTNGFQSGSLEKEKKAYTVELPTLATGFTIGFTGALLATFLCVRYGSRS